MRIGFIGAGRMGFTLGRYMKEHGICVSGYFSRSKENSVAAAEFTDTLCYDDVEQLIKDCDALFLTVSDSAISKVYEEIKQYNLEGKIICHTSGALSSEVFTDSDRLGVYGYSVHPIYAVSDKLTSYKNFHNAFITIEGNARYLETLKKMFLDMGNNVAVISRENKPKYHAAAVCASNFVCGIYGMAKRLLLECNFNEEEAKEALNGLFLDNAAAITKRGVIEALTGPCERNDYETIKKHLDVLNDEEKELYKLLSKEVLELAKIKNEDINYIETEKLISTEY